MYADHALLDASAAFPVHAHQGGALQSNVDIPLFDRECEQELLLKRLMARPDNIIIVLSPPSGGKTRLLRELLLGPKLNAPVSWLSGRSQKLSDGRIIPRC